MSHSILRSVVLFGGLILSHGFVVIPQQQQYSKNPAAFIVTKRNANNARMLHAIARDNVEDPMILKERGIVESPSDIEEGVEDIESFLNEAHSDMNEELKNVNYHSDYGLQDVDDVDDEIEMTKTEIPDDIEKDFLDWTAMTTTEATETSTSGIDLDEDDILDDSSKIESSFVETIIKPHVLQQDVVEEVEDVDHLVHTYRDFATGKELSWTDDDVNPHSVAASVAVGGGLLSSTTPTTRPHPNPKDDHITMGMMGSGKFDAFGVEEETDEVYEEPYTELTTADELCSGNF